MSGVASCHHWHKHKQGSTDRSLSCYISRSAHRRPGEERGKSRDSSLEPIKRSNELPKRKEPRASSRSSKPRRALYKARSQDRCIVHRAPPNASASRLARPVRSTTGTDGRTLSSSTSANYILIETRVHARSPDRQQSTGRSTVPPSSTNLQDCSPPLYR